MLQPRDHLGGVSAGSPRPGAPARRRPNRPPVVMAGISIEAAVWWRLMQRSSRSAAARSAPTLAAAPLADRAAALGAENMDRPGRAGAEHLRDSRLRLVVAAAAGARSYRMAHQRAEMRRRRSGQWTRRSARCRRPRPPDRPPLPFQSAAGAAASTSGAWLKAARQRAAPRRATKASNACGAAEGAQAMAGVTSGEGAVENDAAREQIVCETARRDRPALSHLLPRRPGRCRSRSAGGRGRSVKERSPATRRPADSTCRGESGAGRLATW